MLLSLVFCGAGSRARTYAGIAAEMPERYAIAAAADPVPARVDVIRGHAAKTRASAPFRAFASADELFAAGEKAFESKDLRGARARFLEAYAIRPSFDVLANLGLVEARLGLLRDAA
jgi:hypothetical protein